MASKRSVTSALRLDLAVQRAEGVNLDLPDKWLERVALASLQAAGVRGSVEIALLLAGDDTLQRLNREFRRVDQPTDVLSFPQEEGKVRLITPQRRRRHLGDIAISVERARRQAADYGHSFERELAYLLVHGVLHLAGYDHESDADQRTMRQREEQALDAIGLPRPDAEGTAGAQGVK